MDDVGKPIPWGEQVATLLRAMGQFQVDLTKATTAFVVDDPDSDTVVIAVVTDEFPGGYAIITDRSTRKIISKALPWR